MSNKLATLFLLLFFSFSLACPKDLSAACPITHAYLTKRLFKKFPKYTKAEEQEFMVGTLFPDIRYLGDVTRTETHFESMSLEEVLKEPNPFLAGLKFHTYVDIVREEWVVREGMYDKLRPKIPYHTSSFLKIIEDEYLFPEESWSEVTFALLQTHPNERLYGVSEANITKWHKVLNLLFVSGPSYLLNLFSLTGKGAAEVTAEEVQLWNENLKPYLKDPVIKEWMEVMLKGFDQRFEEELEWECERKSASESPAPPPTTL